MPNKHIALVKKWLANKSSVSYEELRANVSASAASSDYASASYASYAAATSAARSDAYAAAHAAAYAYADASAADYWVKRYEELTNEK